MSKTITWFSAGVSSAVATKMALDRIDEIYYIHIDDQHPDTLRFVQDCQAWFCKSITVLQSKYKNVDAACRASGGLGYVNGPGGAACTKFLKKRVRKDWERKQDEKLCYVWGLDYNEQDRADRILAGMPKQNHIFPLIENKLTKTDAHKILKASGIKRPAMYDKGYLNNNCIGCVKGGMGYWNKIRKDFPAVFAQRASMERDIEGTCIKGVFLDELKPTAGRNQKPIVDDCGIFCEEIGI